MIPTVRRTGTKKYCTTPLPDHCVAVPSIMMMKNRRIFPRVLKNANQEEFEEIFSISTEALISRISIKTSGSSISPFALMR